MLNKFCEQLASKKGFSEITIAGYRQGLISLFKKLGTSRPTVEVVESYMAEFRKNGYSFSHVRNTTVIIERYLEYLGRPLKLPRIKRPRLIIKDTLTEGEIARMLASTNNSREKAIIAILAYSGIRNKEFCQLRVRDIDFDNGFIKIFSGKGNRDRIAYISRNCIRAISDYLRDYPREDDNFLTTTLVKHNRYAGGDLRKVVKVVAKRAKIKKRAYPHLLRHSLAVNLLSRGSNIMTIQQVLGHQSLESTLIYAHSMPQKVQSEYSYFCPNYV